MPSLMLVVVCAVAALALAYLAGRSYDPRERATYQAGAVVAGLVSALSLAFSMFVVVPAGSVGVPIVLGSVQKAYLTEGFHFINPLANVVDMSVRTHTYTMSRIANEGAVVGDDSIEALSKSGMSMKMDVSVPHRLVPASAPWVYKNLGPNYDNEIVRPAIATAVREATSHYTEDEVYATKRADLVKSMRDQLDLQIQNIIRHYGEDAPSEVIVFPEVQLRNVLLPEAVQRAINEKIATEQKIVQAQNEAKRKKVEAEGIKSFQDIVSKGITPDLLRWKGIEATVELAKSENSKIIFIGSGKDGLPLVLSDDGLTNSKK